MIKNRYTQYGILLIATLIWIYFRSDILNHFERMARETFDLLPYTLYPYVTYIIDGFFLGAFAIIGKNISINKPIILIVFLPLFLASSFTIVRYFFYLNLGPIPYSVFTLLSSPVVFNLIGVSLVIGLFSGKRK